MDNVIYVGTATIRQVTQEEWDAAGVTGQKSVRWFPGNGYSVPLSDLTEGAQNILRADGYFIFPGSGQAEAVDRVRKMGIDALADPNMPEEVKNPANPNEIQQANVGNPKSSGGGLSAGGAGSPGSTAGGGSTASGG